ncbi:hypothetical protein QOT17_013789 [Balamuthia mandrillaris]
MLDPSRTLSSPFFLIQIPSCATHIMEASAALDTLREQLRKAQQEYLRMLQQSFQLELDIPSCPETERVAKEEEQRKLDEAAEHTRKAMEWLQQRIDNFVVFLASTSATLGNSSTCNTTAATVSPPSPVPQISPIQSPRSSSPSPIDVSVNNTTASNSTHVPSVPETQSNTTTPSPPTQKKMPHLPPGLPKFDVSKRQDPALHTMELEYHLNAYNYPEDRWTQALITTLVGDGRLWAISALRDQPWNIARDLFHQHYRLPDIEATTIEAVTSFQQKPGESVHQLINQYSVLCNHLPDTFYDYLKAFFFGRALLPHIKSKYKQQTLRNKPQDVIAAFELAVLIESEFPQPSSKDKGHSKSPQRQSPLPHTIGAVCAHCKTRNHTEDQCQKKARRLQRQSSQATSATPASSSAPATRNPTSTLPHQTRAQLPARQSSPSSRSLNSMASTQQQSNTPAPTVEQQDSIGDEEEYDEFYESQRALNSITITDDMPGRL